MRLGIVVMLSLLSGLSTFAQKCDYISNIVSGMDGTHLVITQPQEFAGKSEQGLVEVWAKLHLDSVIVLSIVLHEGKSIGIHKNDSLVIISDEGKKVVLNVMQDVQNLSDEPQKLTVYAFVDNATYSELEGLQVATLTFATANGDLELKSRHQGEKAISNVLYCVHSVMEE